jgi:hypothetical protein
MLVAAAASIKIDPAAWRAQFANTSGAAVITPARTNITLTSGALLIDSMHVSAQAPAHLHCWSTDTVQLAS